MAPLDTISKTGANDDNVIFTANESEVARLDIQHKVIQAAMPKPVLAPINLSKGGLKILDQATGSGIWLRDLRATAPDAHNTYIGTDIEDAYFPKEGPQDTKYFHQSMTESWPADWTGSFDLVHSRMALPGVGTTPLAAVVDNLIHLVKPGGWIQFVEMEWVEWTMGPEMSAFHHAIRKLLIMVTQAQGVDLRPKLRALVGESGLENVGCEVVRVPVGRSAREEVRELSEKSMFATVTGAVETLGKIGAESAELVGLPERVVGEIGERGGEFRMFVLWAQKPVDA